MTIAHQISPEKCAIIQKLELALASCGNSQEKIDSFWNEVKQSPYPIIGSCHDNTRETVTFLARGSSDCKFGLVGPVNAWEIESSKFTYVEGSDVFWHSLTLPKNFRGTYYLTKNDSFAPLDNATNWEERSRFWSEDLLNPKKITFYKNPDDPSDYDSSRSVLELSEATAQPWLANNLNAAKGSIEEFVFHSEILSNSRRIAVYRPFLSEKVISEFPVLIVYDGDTYLRSLNTPQVLDNLIHAGKIPPLVAVFVDNVSSELRNTELPCNEKFINMLSDELLPRISQMIPISNDPHLTCTAGSSYGGLASIFAAYHRPDRFGLMLAQAPSMYWADSKGEVSWLLNRLSEKVEFAQRAHIDVGFYDRFAKNQGEPNLYESVQRLKNILEDAGVLSSYVEYCGGHDYAWWRGTIADGLIALFGKALKE